MNWINPDQNLVGSVKQIQSILKGTEHVDTVESHTLQQVKDAGFKMGWTDELCEKYYHKRNGTGWIDGSGREIKQLTSDMINLKNSGYLDVADAKDDKQAILRKACEYDDARNKREGTGIMASINPSGTVTPDENLF